MFRGRVPNLSLREVVVQVDAIAVGRGSRIRYFVALDHLRKEIKVCVTSGHSSCEEMGQAGSRDFKICESGGNIFCRRSVLNYCTVHTCIMRRWNALLSSRARPWSCERKTSSPSELVVLELGSEVSLEQPEKPEKTEAPELELDLTRSCCSSFASSYTTIARTCDHF